MRYSKDYDKIIAVISHLATVEGKSGTVNGIATKTSIPDEEVERILGKYKEFFVQVPFKSDKKQDVVPYYTLHLRYGLRRGNIENDHRPLSEVYTSMLINLVMNQVIQENEIRKSKSQNTITMIAAIIAAVSAVLAVIIK